MSLTKDFFERPTNITAKVICDSISEAGIRLTTFELEYPRFIHSEMMTHRGLSKNSSSSRAIPIQKMIDQTLSNTAVPLYWGSKKSGMQAGAEVQDVQYSIGVWMTTLSGAIGQTELLEGEGVHKQTANRLLEPFQMMKVVVTGTDWENFFNLRIHPDAQPEICMLAYQMYKAMQESEPYLLKEGEWHLPYVNLGWDGNGKLRYADENYNFICLGEAIKLSAASCASVSYRTEGVTLEKANKIFEMLIKAEMVHASPFEHLATPTAPTNTWKGQFKDQANSIYPETWQEGVTHINKQGQLCSGNLRGWVQYRHLLPNNTAWSFDFEGRMKLFDELKQT